MTTKFTSANQSPHAGAVSEAEWLQIEPGVQFKVIASTNQTRGSYACMETIALKGTGSPIHIHHREDEHFVVLEGTLHVVLDDKTFDVPARQTISLPRGIRHAWSNKSDTPLHFIALFTPGGFDQLCVEMATSGGFDLAEITERFGLELIGPEL